MTVETQPRFKLGVSLVLILLAVICFVLAAFGVGSKLGIDIVDIGLAFFAGSFIF